ncbi:MAG: hypothetical protein JWM85_2954 [Acidimicrobiaceae bacterium]|nr:hypothetical protein [Acidimicrobiaceae bacterium]
MTVSEIGFPAPEAVSFGEGADLAGVAWRWPSADISLLFLHDVGTDLDSLRWLCAPLVAAGITCLSLDLAGHGLSAGDFKADGERAVHTAWTTFTAGLTGVAGVVAEGAAVDLMFATDFAKAPVSAVCLSPRQRAGGGVPAPSWRLVPKLVILESEGTGDSAYADTIIESTNAWCLRADLSPSCTEGDRSHDYQVASLTLKFLLEQAAFELAGRTQPGEAL